ncbi:hypothetical protein [Aeromonas schubertii]|uniref:hypothetical protein n=1 Tax=Aeromonas schubertii TaxID=652 RepID=UPI001CC739E9|nr:hypothetical protein [Aeromonas schubertii]MBZ6074491.1 hypothetical protein [Aeromonas schubertii]
MRIVSLLVGALFWLLLLLSPLLLMLALSFVTSLLTLGGEVTLTNWPLVLVSSLAVSLPVAVVITEWVRRRYGVIALFGRLLHQTELTTPPYNRQG